MSGGTLVGLSPANRNAAVSPQPVAEKRLAQPAGILAESFPPSESQEAA